MSRFHIILCAVFSCCLLTTPLSAQSIPSGAIPDLKGLRAQMIQKELTAALNARSKEEKAFILEVLQLVQENKISPKMVQASFMEIMKKPSEQPLVDFERVLRKTAKQPGQKDIVPLLKKPNS